MLLRYNLREFSTIKILELTGDLTETSGQGLEEIVLRIIERESLMIDVSGVIIVTSGGLKYLVELSMEARDRGQRIIILYPGEELRSLAETADSYHLLIFAESPEEGETKIRHYT
jgi:anti-anti-sigma regulatory factor